MKYVAAVIIAFVLMSCTSSQRITYLQLPSEAKADSVDVASYENKYGKYDGVYLIYDQSIEHSGKNTGEGYFSSWDFHYVVRHKYIVLNPDAQWLTTFTLNTNKRAKIGTLYMQISSPNGTVTRYGIKDLIKEIDSDGFIKYKFIYPNVTKGSVVDEGFELSYDARTVRPPLKHDIALQFRIPCEQLSFQYAYPDWWNINVKKLSEIAAPLYVVTHDTVHNKNVLSFTAKDIPAIKSEPYSPYFKEVAQYLEFMITKLEMGAWRYEAAESWEKYAERFKPFVLHREGFLTSRVANTTEDVIGNATTPFAKLDTIMSFLQNTIEVVSDGKDRDFTDVLKEKKGDPYNITGLAHSMLTKAGFTPEYLVIHSAEDGNFDPSFYSFDQLPIPAVSVVIEGKEYVLFPYRKEVSIDQIPEYVQGQTALAVADKGPALLKTVALGSGTKNIVEDAYDVTIGEDGMLNVKETKTFRGSLALHVREKLDKMKTTERDKFAKELLTYTDGDVKMISYSFENEKLYKQPLVIKFDYTIDNLVTLTPEEVLFHTGGLFAPATIKDMSVESEERHNPIRIHFDEDYTKTIVIHYPQMWRVKTELPPLAIENNFGSLSAQYEKNPGELKVTQHRFLKRSSEPKEKIAELAALAGSKSRVALPTVIFGR